MMQQRQEVLMCSACGQQQKIVIYPHIDIAQSPELKQQVLNHELFSPKCLFCHQSLALIYPCVYHDPHAKVLVYVAPFYQPGDEKTLKYDLFNHLEESEGYLLRVVTDFQSLIESLLLFYHQLDDRIYQIAKEMIASQIQSQIAPRQLVQGYIQSKAQQLYFNYVDNQQQSYQIPLDHDIVAIVREVYTDRLIDNDDFELIDFVWAKQMIEAWD